MKRTLAGLVAALTACVTPELQKPQKLKPSYVEGETPIKTIIADKQSTVSDEALAAPRALVQEQKVEQAKPNEHLEEVILIYREAVAAAGEEVKSNREVLPYTPNAHPRLAVQIPNEQKIPDLVVYRDGLRLIHYHPDLKKREIFRRKALEFFLLLGYKHIDEIETVSDELKDYCGLIELLERRGAYWEAAIYSEKQGDEKRALLNYSRSDYATTEAVELARRFIRKRCRARDYFNAIKILETKARNTDDVKLLMEAGRAARERKWWKLASKYYGDAGAQNAGYMLMQSDARPIIEQLFEEGKLTVALSIARDIHDDKMTGLIEGIIGSRIKIPKATSCSRFYR